MAQVVYHFKSHSMRAAAAAAASYSIYIEKAMHTEF